MYTVDEETSAITLTRGDTFKANITILNPDGSEYVPVEGDKVRFAMKKDYNDAEPLLNIDIPIDTMNLTIQADDTKKFPFGKYVYDIELTKATGEVDTFIYKKTIKLTEEVH